MPSTTVPILGGASAVQAKIAELEQAGCEITGVDQIGDQHLIRYKAKPRAGRPPRETR